MTHCYQPLTAYRLPQKITFSHSEARKEYGQLARKHECKLRCGKCLTCLKKIQNEWVVRATHEMNTNDDNCMITLTYNDANVKKELVHRDFQLFMKRLRKRTGKKIKYFMAGEYGDKNGRPHYHAIIFGYDPQDKKVFSKKGLNTLYTSAELEDIWGLGYASVGMCNGKTISYVIKYITKSRYEKEKWKEAGIQRPYTQMSRGTGLGKDWLDKNIIKVMKKKIIKITKYTYSIPKYYLNKIKEKYEDWYKKYKEDALELVKEITDLQLKNIKIKYEKEYNRKKYLHA